MSDYKQQVIDFFNRRTAYDAEGDSHPREAKLLLESVPFIKSKVRSQKSKVSPLPKEKRIENRLIKDSRKRSLFNIFIFLFLMNEEALDQLRALYYF